MGSSGLRLQPPREARVPQFCIHGQARELFQQVRKHASVKEEDITMVKL